MVRATIATDNPQNLADFTAEILEAASRYAQLGWHVVPLKPRDKAPYLTAWQKNSSTDMQQIRRWWQKRPDSNIGIQLGPRSGIIDIECDSDAAEEELQKLFNHEVPRTCSYRSTRGTHRLFKWREGMVPQAMFKWQGVEFRLGNGDMGAQSVFPPSVNEHGEPRVWIVAPDECPPAELPDFVFELLRGANAPERKSGTGKTKAKPASHFTGLLKGVGEGNRNQSAAELIGRVLADMADPCDNSACLRQYEFVRMWNNSNQPPLDERELRQTFESILTRERIKRQSQFAATHAGEPAFGTGSIPQAQPASTAITVRPAATPAPSESTELAMDVQLELETLRRKLGLVRVVRDSDDADAVYSVELNLDGTVRNVSVGDARKVKRFADFKTAIVAATRQPFPGDLKPMWDRLSDAILITSVTLKTHSAADALGEWLEAFVVHERPRLYPQRHHERFDLGYHTFESILCRKSDERSFVGEGGVLWLKTVELKRFVYQNFQESVKIGDLSRMLQAAGFERVEDTPTIAGKRVHLRYWRGPVPGSAELAVEHERRA